jgi:hypothetical protein
MCGGGEGIWEMGGEVDEIKSSRGLGMERNAG